MLKICVFAVTAFLIYTFASPAANEFYESEKARNIYLNQNLDRSLRDKKILADSSDTNLNDLKEKLAETKKINGYFGIKFNELKIQTAENGNLIVFLNDLTKLAQKNNVKIAKTNEQIAAVTYEATIKKALGEVRDALNSRRFAQDALKLADELLISQEKIYELSKNRFDEGYSSHLELLDAQRNLLSTKLSQINAKLNLIDSVVNIYKAFGGGFTAQK